MSRNPVDLHDAIEALEEMKNIDNTILGNFEQGVLQGMKWARGDKIEIEEPPGPVQCAHGYVLTGDCPTCPENRRILPKGNYER